MMRVALICLTVVLGGAQAPAQTLSGGIVQSQILTIEFDRAFGDSAFGRRVAAEIERQGAVLAAENRRIETELIDEERALTERRAGLPPEEFRPLADAFDERVQRLRREQDTKARNLGARTDEARRQFLVAAEPVLRAIMRETGGAVLVERRSVLLSLDSVDVTDLAIRRIDAQIGDGSTLPPIASPGQAQDQPADQPADQP